MIRRETRSYFTPRVNWPAAGRPEVQVSIVNPSSSVKRNDSTSTIFETAGRPQMTGCALSALKCHLSNLKDYPQLPMGLVIPSPIAATDHLATSISKSIKREPNRRRTRSFHKVLLFGVGGMVSQASKYISAEKTRAGDNAKICG